MTTASEKERADPSQVLNSAQLDAVRFKLEDPRALPSPLLIVAGAGTGKTRTLVHRVARAVSVGFDPIRILLLTFTRRAAEEMTRRVRTLVRGVQSEESANNPGLTIEWSGTFHAVASRLLRSHARAIGLDPNFTVLDEGDAQDLLDLKRAELGLDRTTHAFPKKDTCLAIYSARVNRSLSLEDVLKSWFPQYLQFIDELRHLFRAYVDAKRDSHVVDFDDLLLFWKLLLEHSTAAEAVREQFDLVFVDEFQDTNPLQGDILRLLKPEGRGVTVVGDEAQSIYAFRGTTIQNMLDFPGQYEPPAEVITLKENYRSVQPILDVANDVLAEAREGFRKTLTAHRDGGTLPRVVSVDSLTDEAAYVVEQILVNREAGWALADQAVLVRVGHHTYQLETELVRRQIPYVKYGGQKLLEAAHIRDVLTVLRWVENPCDEVAAFRTLQLLPKIGPKRAREAFATFQNYRDFSLLSMYPAPAGARERLSELVELLHTLAHPSSAWPGQVPSVREWYEPLLEGRYDNWEARVRDLEELERIATGFPSRAQFLADLALDPIEKIVRPRAADDEDDHFVLSTIHSAKGLEWRAVFVLRVIDGVVPSFRAETAEEIEEERRLLYVAVTRAQDELDLLHPLRLRRVAPGAHDGGELRQRSRFLPAAALDRFEQIHYPAAREAPEEQSVTGSPVDLAGLARQLWE